MFSDNYNTAKNNEANCKTRIREILQIGAGKNVEMWMNLKVNKVRGHYKYNIQIVYSKG